MDRDMDMDIDARLARLADLAVRLLCGLLAAAASTLFVLGCIGFVVGLDAGDDDLSGLWVFLGAAAAVPGLVLAPLASVGAFSSRRSLGQTCALVAGLALAVGGWLAVGWFGTGTAWVALGGAVLAVVAVVALVTAAASSTSTAAAGSSSARTTLGG